ncbi:HEAT repeat domain-containing protein [Methylosoma difficile]
MYPNLSSLHRYGIPAALSSLAIVLLMHNNVQAETNTPQQPAPIQLKKDTADSLVQLVVDQAPLAQVLDTLSSQTHTPIHYSVLPETLVSANCKDSNLRKIIECLLQPRPDLAFRYADGSFTGTADQQPVEIWLLGSMAAARSGHCVAVTVVADDRSQPRILQTPPEPSQDALNESKRLLKQATSKDPVQRAEAIANLGLSSLGNDPKIAAALKNALNDPDPSVRAQAVSSWVQRERDGGSGELQQALQDSDTNVRFTAVSSSNDSALLEMALNDADESIRELAKSKLADLSARENRH